MARGLSADSKGRSGKRLGADGQGLNGGGLHHWGLNGIGLEDRG